MLTACTRKTCSICGSFHGSKGKCPVETLNAQQEAKAGITAGEDLTNRQVRALREAEAQSWLARGSTTSIT
jgi:hypothetical protein